MQRKPRVRVVVPEHERRRSTRERVAINYAEKYGLDDEDDIAAARRRGASSAGRKKPKLASMSDGDFARRRFSVGARVYDSELGVTCHWCRQKTVETHVFCTAEGGGKGRSAPLAFCGMCLRNRHSEDIDAAVASGIWTCPRCRGSCGDGCVTCCNCGPCRKAHGLAPTHQVIQLARGAGFDNVHDYLVHGATGLTPDVLLERKKSFNWGKWLAKGFEPAKKAATPAAVNSASGSARTPKALDASREPTKKASAKTAAAKAAADIATGLCERRAAALAERAAEKDANGDDAFAARAAPATPSPAKGRDGRKRPWAAAIGAMASSPASAKSQSRRSKSLPNGGRPASPATPEADTDVAPRARRATARGKELFPAAPEPTSSPPRAEPPRKARAVFSRQGDIRAMFAVDGGARATRSRAAGAA